MSQPAAAATRLQSTFRGTALMHHVQDAVMLKGKGKDAVRLRMERRRVLISLYLFIYNDIVHKVHRTNKQKINLKNKIKK